MSNFISTPFLGTQDPSSNFSTYHPFTRRYVASLGETPSDIARVEEFVRALDLANLLENLQDGCLMSTAQNVSTGTSLKSLKGVPGVLTASPVVGTYGMQLNGSTQYAYWPIPDTRVQSTVIGFTGVTSGQTSSGVLFSFQNATYGWSGANSGAMKLVFNGTAFGNIYTAQSGSATICDTLWEGEYSAFCSHPVNPYPSNFICTTDNATVPTLKCYVNGRLLVTDSTANTQATTQRDQFVVGARIAAGNSPTNFCKGVFPYWLVFNKVLTDAEAALVEAACRWLDPRPKNAVFSGDSLTAFFVTKATDSWPYQLQKLDTTQKSRYINTAKNGIQASTILTNYDSWIKPYKPYVNGVTGGADFYLVAGTNDLINSVSGATTYTYLTQLWAKARADGFTVHASTIPKGSGYTAPQETERLALNVLITGSPELYDTLFRPELLLPDAGDTTFYLDTYHLKPLGNSVIANARAACQKPSTLSPRTVPLTDAATIATDASLVPEGGVCYVTLGGNRTLGAPTNPTAGQEIIYRFIQDGTGNRTLALASGAGGFRAGPVTTTQPVAAAAIAYMRVIYNLASDRWDVLDFRQAY